MSTTVQHLSVTRSSNSKSDIYNYIMQFSSLISLHVGSYNLYLVFICLDFA